MKSSIIYSSLKILALVFVLGFSVFAGWDLVTPKPTENNLNSVHFIDSLTGWIAGFGDSYNGEIFHSNDGGLTWIKQDLGKNTTLMDIYFLNNEKGWVGGNSENNGEIFLTENGGDSWNLIYTDTNIIHNILFIDENKGWATNFDEIMRTNDGGNTWNIQYTSTVYDFNSIFFINPTTGWVCGDWGAGDGIIFNTKDGGVTWTKQFDNNENDRLWDIYFTDVNNGWAVGDDGLSVRTEDGGETWTVKYLPRRNRRAVHFTDRKTGWIVGWEGRASHTSDGGETWETIYLDTNNSYTDIFFTDHYHGWTVGTNGTIFRTTDGGGYPYPIIHNPQIVTDNLIIQNYSNPINKNLKLTFTLTKRDHIKIGIYSISGRLVKQLLDGVKGVGEHSISWDIQREGVATGSYIMRIRAGEGEVSKRIVVIQ